jgi:ABC-type lipoprotein release transport system permease subunit
MGATWFRARADLRGHLRSAIALAILLGLFGGAVLAAAAGARRTDTAYDRFLEETRSQDLFVLSGDSGVDAPTVDLHKVVKLPQVRLGVVVSLIYGLVTTEHGAVLTPDGGLTALPDEVAAQDVFRPKILAGRLPNFSRIDEIAVGYRSNPPPDVRVGAVVTIRVVKASVGASFGSDPRKLPPDDFLPPIRAKIVGIVLQQGEVQGSSDVFLTPAFGHAYLSRAATIEVAVIELRRHLVDFPAFTRELDAIAPQAFVLTTRDEAVFVHRSTHLQAVALWLFAGLSALAGVVIFGQALARQLFVDSSENPTLRALGMTRAELAAVAMVRAVSIAVIGVVLAAGLAVALSPLMPLGLARLVEPSPGVNFDPLIVGAGAVALAILIIGLALLPAWRASRVRGDSFGTAEWSRRTRPSTVADAAARTGLPPTVVAGVRMALEPGRGRTAVPVWSTLLGVTLSVLAFVTAASLGTSFSHLVETPRLSGWGNIQLGSGNPFVEDMADAVLPAISSDRSISAYAVGNIAHSVQIGSGAGVKTFVLAMDERKGSVHVTVAEGKWPTSSDEIALGAKSLRASGAHLGGTVRVRGEGPAIPMRVVGRVVLPEGEFGPGLGEGAAMSFEALKRFIPEAQANFFVMRVTAGANPRKVARGLDPLFARFDTNVSVVDTGVDEGGAVTNLRRAQAVPIGLAGILGVAAVGTLVHTLVTSMRRRRRDLAILKTLGFLTRQVSAAVAWQATTLVAVALIVGVPLGLATGRWGWTLFADQLGIVPEPIMPIATTLLAIPAAIIAANLIAVIPGRLAGRTRPAMVLRAE